MFLDAKWAFMSSSSPQSPEFAFMFSNITDRVFTKFKPKLEYTAANAQKAIYAIGNATFNSTEQLQEINALFSVVQDSLFDNFGIKLPKKDIKSIPSIDSNDNKRHNMDAFVLVVSIHIPSVEVSISSITMLTLQQTSSSMFWFQLG
jgi:hypothetical protein